MAGELQRTFDVSQEDGNLKRDVRYEHISEAGVAEASLRTYRNSLLTGTPLGVINVSILDGVRPIRLQLADVNRLSFEQQELCVAALCDLAQQLKERQ